MLLATYVPCESGQTEAEEGPVAEGGSKGRSISMVKAPGALLRDLSLTLPIKIKVSKPETVENRMEE